MSTCDAAPMSRHHWAVIKYCLIFLFGIMTGSLFIYLNHVQPYYFIDEVFHIPQTLQYCAGNFRKWDPKITTLPGLYVITALILSPLNLCNTICIRSINLIGTLINLYLTYHIIKEIHKNNHTYLSPHWMQFIVAFNVTLFPPLFFWCFLYYTDVVSVNMILLMLLLHLRKCFKQAAFTGLMSILIRQTNIIWVAFFALEQLLDILDYKAQANVHPKLFRTTTHLKLLWNTVVQEASYGPSVFRKFITQIFIDVYPYIAVGLIFLSFVIWNEGIVVGDRAAHVPTVHVPQIFYFSVFVFCFSWPYMITYWYKFLNSMQQNWVLTSCLFVCITIIIHCNTLVHPYVLADNRHYVFYVWNRLMGKYIIFKYLLIPVYCFSIYGMLQNINHLRFLTQISYVSSVCIVLIPQLLLEPRYFIIPYILFRLNIQKPKNWQIVMESVTTLIVNFVQFFIFVNKVFYWQDQDHPQRIAW